MNIKNEVGSHLKLLQSSMFKVESSKLKAQSLLWCKVQPIKLKEKSSIKSDGIGFTDGCSAV
jgi:hypothetical protein